MGEVSGDPAVVVLTDAAQALGHLELAGLTILELTARTVEPNEGTTDVIDAQLDVSAAHRVDTHGIDYKCSAGVNDGDRVVFAEGVVHFRSEGRVEWASPEVIRDFGTKVAVMTIYPYLRQLLEDLAGRIRVGLTLPLLRQGDWTVTAAE